MRGGCNALTGGSTSRPDLEIHTYSLVAQCDATGMVGAASASGRPFLGSVLPLVAPGRAIVASQALASPVLASRIIGGLISGASLPVAAADAIAGDPGQAKRQIAAVSWDGSAYGFTGSNNVPWAGHHVGARFVVAGNMLAGPGVLHRMIEAYESSDGRELAERLLLALEAAATNATADVRGKVSSILYVDNNEPCGYVNIRVDESEDAVAELRWLFKVWKVTQRTYQLVMPTRHDPAGVLDDSAIERARRALNRYPRRPSSLRRL